MLYNILKDTSIVYVGPDKYLHKQVCTYLYKHCKIGAGNWFTIH